LRETAEYTLTGTITRPKEMAPLQIARAIFSTLPLCENGDSG
jgi:hypothetical protein